MAAGAKVRGALTISVDLDGAEASFGSSGPSLNSKRGHSE